MIVAPAPATVQLSMAVLRSRDRGGFCRASPLESGPNRTACLHPGCDTLTTLQPSGGLRILRFLAGVYVWRHGAIAAGLTTMFIRGGDSDYNKVIVDGVPVDEDGGYFDLGVVPDVSRWSRVEMVRGAASALYGSDAMTSVTQIWSAVGHDAPSE